jgi:hypothetical protein
MNCCDPRRWRKILKQSDFGKRQQKSAPGSHNSTCARIHPVVVIQLQPQERLTVSARQNAILFA